MKESSGKTKKPSKGVRRARSMRNVVMMVLVCVLMLSAATYAWFTLSRNAKVANLSMSVGEESSLMIAPDTDRTGKPGEYGNVLKFDTNLGDDVKPYKIKFPLKPATMESDKYVYQPSYDDTGLKVDDVKKVTEYMTDLSENESANYFCYQTTFYLKTAGKSSVYVQLQPSTLANTWTAPTDGEGTYILNKEDGNHGAAAVRISLTDESGNTIVYEPLSDDTFTDTDDIQYATDTRDDADPITTTSAQLSDGTIPTQSKTLEVSTTGTKITMCIWLEGTDDECVNQIMGSDLTGQIAFEVKETVTSGSTANN